MQYQWSVFEKSETPAAVRLKEGINGLHTRFERDYKRMDGLKHILYLRRFYGGLRGKDTAYYGGIVTPKDADKVLLRWKVSDNEYRAIFGDLHTETVTTEKLTELEKDLQK